MIRILFLDILKFFLTGIAVLYVSLVVMTLRNEGSRYELKLDPDDPARSVERLLVWLGVRSIAALAAFGKACLNILEDTSADVGEWVLNRRKS
ncbi:MAG TPA: hypothetical protein VKV79_06680 [Terriglobia bacterium]|jgi:hypothetical protein|nr:hypothetical protein [Terriglobia bacterium]